MPQKTYSNWIPTTGTKQENKTKEPDLTNNISIQIREHTRLSLYMSRSSSVINFFLNFCALWISHCVLPDSLCILFSTLLLILFAENPRAPSNAFQALTNRNSLVEPLLQCVNFTGSPLVNWSSFLNNNNNSYLKNRFFNSFSA